MISRSFPYHNPPSGIDIADETIRINILHRNGIKTQNVTHFSIRKLLPPARLDKEGMVAFTHPKTMNGVGKGG